MKPHDELLERYAQAKAQLPDGLPSEPPAALHEIIMRAAREQATTMSSIALSADSIPATSPKKLKNTIPSTEAANDSFWRIKAVASIAVMGLSALLWWQFEQGTPQEQEAAKSAQPSPAALATAPVTTPAASPLPTPGASRAAVIQQEIRAETSSAEKKSITAAPAKVTQEVAQHLAKPSAAPTPASPTLAERARTQDMAAARQTDKAEAANAEPSIAADTTERSAAAKSSTPAPASKRFNAEAQGALSQAPAAAPAARAATSMATSPAPNPLLAALQTRDAAALRQALTQGAFPNARTPDGNPALIQAVIQRWPEGARILLAAGADKQAKNNKGHTAADVALELGYSDITELLATAR